MPEEPGLAKIMEKYVTNITKNLILKRWSFLDNFLIWIIRAENFWFHGAQKSVLFRAHLD